MLKVVKNFNTDVGSIVFDLDSGEEYIIYGKTLRWRFFLIPWVIFELIELSTKEKVYYGYNDYPEYFCGCVCRMKFCGEYGDFLLRYSEYKKEEIDVSKEFKSEHVLTRKNLLSPWKRNTRYYHDVENEVILCTDTLDTSFCGIITKRTSEYDSRNILPFEGNEHLEGCYTTRDNRYKIVKR